MPIFDITRIYNYNEHYLVKAENTEEAYALVWEGADVEPYHTSEASGHGELLIDEIDEEQAAKIRKEWNIS